jgi:hypothetical protein
MPSYNYITQKEYYEFLINSIIVEKERCVFSSFSGPHEFCTIISKNGMIYELGWGWDDVSNSWFGFKTLGMDFGQHGEGI